MINMKEKQKSFRFALISLIAFILVTIVAFIDYTNDSGAISGWTNPEEALNNAKSSGKPVLINFYSRFNQVSKNLNDQILKIESVENFLNDNFELASVNVTGDDDEKYVKDNYDIDVVPALIFLKPNGDELFRYSGQGVMGMMNMFVIEDQQKDLIDEINYFMEMKDFDQAVADMGNKSDYMIIFAVKDPQNARKVMLLLRGEAIKKYIDNTFEKVYLISSNEDDKTRIKDLEKEYLNETYPDNDDKESIKLSVGDVVEEFILILDKNKNYVSHFNPQVNLYDDEAFINKLKNILNEYETKVSEE